MPPALGVTAAARLQDVPIELAAFGAMEASESVTIKPMVSGELVTVGFQEGADVEKNAPLFTIDPRPHQAALDKARQDFERYRQLAAGIAESGTGGGLSDKGGGNGRFCRRSGDGCQCPRPAFLLHHQGPHQRTIGGPGRGSGQCGFANAERRLWAGQFVTLSLLLDVKKQAVVVPAQAVQTGQKGPVVLVISSDLTAEVRPVTPGPRRGDHWSYRWWAAC